MSKTKVTKSSGNVFVDLGIPNPEVHEFKAQLVFQISRQMADRKLSQTKAAAIAGVGQPDLSKMLNGQFRTFSVEKLFGIMTQLGLNVTVKVSRPKKKRKNERPGTLAVAA